MTGEVSEQQHGQTKGSSALCGSNICLVEALHALWKQEKSNSIGLSLKRFQLDAARFVCFASFYIF